MKILITGGTGFLGQELIERLSEKVPLTQIRVVARNEGKLIELSQKFKGIEIITGDISDECIVRKSLQDVDRVYHLAAFKHVGLAETQPIQCILSNINGTYNLLKYFHHGLFIAISTDKAAQVSGIYGATKLCMEGMIQQFESMNKLVQYRVVRYGNVLYSTGSVLCKWKKALMEGTQCIVTDFNATRYYWTVHEAIQLIFDCTENANDSTPYCPEMKSIKIRTLFDAMQLKYGACKSLKEIGLQPGENMHEKITKDGKYSNEVNSYSLDEVIAMV